jgi:transcription elongation factor GreA-like protein
VPVASPQLFEIGMNDYKFTPEIAKLVYEQIASRAKAKIPVWEELPKSVQEQFEYQYFKVAEISTKLVLPFSDDLFER